MSKRKIWFITRPERDPKYHIDALKALQIVTNNFNEKWSANRELHKRYEYELAKQDIKRKNISDSGSGGRTWAAMLRTFGYIYTDPNTQKLVPTKVGIALLQNKKIKENVTKQILTLQIPNAYFLEKGFKPKYEETFKIQPARFLIDLSNQRELDFFITKEEITLFALPAQRQNQLFEITQQIKNFRLSSEDERKEIRKQVAAEYDHRERSDKGARDYRAAHGDVAHTFMLLCHYTELVDYIRGDALRMPANKQKNTTNKLNEFEKRYPFNNRYKISLERFAENAGLDVDSYKASSYGNIAPATNNAKNLRKVHQLLSDLPVIQTLTQLEIATKLEVEFTPAEANKYAALLVQSKYSSLNEDFVDSFINELDPLKFEEKTASVLRSLGFEVDLRPRLSNGLQTEIEIIIHIDENNICLLDAKNYRKKFTLSANLASHMSSEYIPNYQGYSNKNVSTFGYITASDWGGEKNLNRITEKTKMLLPESNIQGVLIQAKALLGFLDYCLENEIDVPRRKEMLISCFTNKGYNTVSDMIHQEN